jgi:threonine dehydratase
VGTALRIVGGQGTAYVARSAAPLKVAKLRATGMQIVTVDGDALEAERTARRVAAARGAAYISPYNDPEVIVGQGTVGVEMLEQLPSVRTVFIACGGGGLLGGIGGCLRAARPDVRLVACWPENSPALNASIDAGRVVEAVDLPTLSDGTAGNLEEGSITLPLCRDLVDERVLVSEREIAAAMRDVLLADHLAIEGAAGVAVAAYRRVARERPDLVDGDSVIVLCGGNVDAATLRRVLEEPA